MVDEVDLASLERAYQRGAGQAGLLAELTLRGVGEGLVRLDFATCREQPALPVVTVSEVPTLEEQDSRVRASSTIGLRCGRGGT